MSTPIRRGCCPVAPPPQAAPPASPAMISRLFIRSPRRGDQSTGLLRAENNDRSEFNLELEKQTGWRDGRSVHAVSFDIVPLPQDFSDLEHAIVLLTIRFLGSEGDWTVTSSPRLRAADLFSVERR